MGNRVVESKLDALGINHNELEILRRISVEERCDDGMYGHRLAGAGGAGDQ